jgi:hypothetical protein
MSELLVPVILSGGAGTRLWPMSRRAHPKPFMRVGEGDTLLARTLARATAVADAGAPIYTLTAKDYLFLTRAEYRRAAPGLGDRARFLLEPAGRNTAPALILAALGIARAHGERTVMLVLPADHLIRDLDAFKGAVATARALADSGRLVTFGVVPTRPETAYGYVERGAALGTWRVRSRALRGEARSRDRPSATCSTARTGGTPACSASGRRADLGRAHGLPGTPGRRERCAADTHWDEQPVRFASDGFLALPSISIDYAVMERAASSPWSKRASTGATSAPGARSRSSPHRTPTATAAAATRCWSTHATATCWPASRTVAPGRRERPDRGRDRRRRAGRAHRARPGREARGRGAGRPQAPGRRAPPDRAPSLGQLHRARGRRGLQGQAPGGEAGRGAVAAEARASQRALDRGAGHAKVRVGDNEFLLAAGETTHIPKETLHRLENPGTEDIALIEVQTGDYFGEDDIVRLEIATGGVLG